MGFSQRVVGDDADWFHTALAERGIIACITSKTDRKY